MSLGPRLELRQSQQLIMTPQLQQAIKLLALTNVELESFIEAEIEKNPLLVPGDAPAADTAAAPDAAPALSAGESGLDQLIAAPGSTESPLDADYAGDTFHHDSPSDSGDWSRTSGSASVNGGANGSGEPGEGVDFDSFAASEASLAELLQQQAATAFDGVELVIARHICDQIDDAGYLQESLETIADRLGVELALTEAVLAGIHRFEPTGVGARSLGECLALQAIEADRYDPAMAALLDRLDLVARGDIAALCRICGVDRDDVSDMIRELRCYDPKPGLRHGGDRMQPVVADIFVRRTAAGEWVVELNQDTLPKVLVDHSYAATLGGGGKAANAFVSDCLQNAHWLIRALDQRARTIVRVATELVRHQQGFFETGLSQLKPLTLRTIADAIEMHESTVSRVTSNKYLQCERGLFELRYFFSSGIASADGGEASSALAVKDRIARLIATEPAETYSDDRLVDLLRGEGFDIARRTVAKYREALGLGSSVARRRARLLAAA